MVENTMATLIITIVVLVVIFLLLREVMCWYYKINDIKSLLEQIVLKLNALSSYKVGNDIETDTRMKPMEVKVETSSDKTEGMIPCKSCGEMRKPGGMCPNCGSWQT